MTELKKCPFCGGKHIIKTYFNWNPALLCSCGAVMTVPMDWRTNKEGELERKWNTRKPADECVEALEENAFPDFEEEYTCNGAELLFLSDAIQIVKEHLKG